MLEPDVVLELAFGQTCPNEDRLRIVQETAKNAILGKNPGRVLCICSKRTGFNEVIVSVGVWSGNHTESEEELKDALLAARPLTPGRGLVLLITANELQSRATAAWREKPKKIDLDVGFVRLNEDISVRIVGREIVTRVTGKYKVRFLPNVSFTYTVRDTLDRQIIGAVPPLVANTEAELSVSDIAKYGFIAGLISPLLGGLIFWKGDELAEGMAPRPALESPGAALASGWPSQILTPIAEGLPGKLTLLWTNLEVDSRGIRTLGAFIPQEREPAVSIQGRRSITVQLPTHAATEKYRLVLRDLRGSVSYRWRIDGVKAGKRSTQTVEFGTLGFDPGRETREVSIEVEDVDGLAASDHQTISFEVVLPEGTQPP